jgi:hypothetical protein
MSYQVGLSCYATAVDAGQAACASFVPVSNIDASGVRTVGCSGVDATGAMLLSVATTDNSGATNYRVISQNPVFPNCIQADYLAAGEQIAGSVLAAACVIYGLWKVKSYLSWNRGDHV